MTQPSHIFLYAHTHWDREWYLSFRQYQYRLLRVMDEIIDALHTQLLPNFTLDGQTVLLEDYLALRPDKEAEIREFIKQGVLDIGPWYVMPDEFLVSGESLIRNLKKGIQQSRQWGSQSKFTGYLPDTFGHSQDIPTILNGVGIDTAIVWRGINPNNPAFTWQSPSQSNVSAYHLKEGYFQMMLHDVDLDDTEKLKALNTLENRLQACAGNLPVLIPIGGDHLGLPYPQILKQALAQYPANQWATISQFMTHHVKPALKTTAETQCITGELTDNSAQFILPGVYSSRLYLKVENKKLEHQLTQVIEPLMTLAKDINPNTFHNKQALLDTAWTQLLLNHPHDSICGCSTDEVHRQNEVRFNEVSDIKDCLIDDCIKDILTTQNVLNHWVVINTGSTPYTGIVHIREETSTNSHLPQTQKIETQLTDQWRFDNRQVPLSHKTQPLRHGWIYVENLPPMSINTLDKNTPLAPPQSMSVVCKPDWLENQYYQIQVAKNGTLKILDKQTGVTYQNMGQLSIRGEQGDSYNGAPNPKVPIKYPTLSKTTLNHQGPLVGNLTLYHQLDGQTYQTTITLNANDAMVYFDTQFINTLKDVCVHVGFETETPIQTVLAETHFGTINRHYNPHYNITQPMPAPAQTELKTNTGPIQRFITANNHYIVTEGLTEYEVEKKQLKLTLLRTFEQISSPDTGVRGTQAGPPFTTPEGQCLNRSMAFRYGWCPDPHDTSTQFNLANQFYGSIVAFDSDLLKPESKAPSKKSESTIISNQALFFWKNPAIQKSACYPIKDGYILRLFNTQNTHQSLALNFQVPPASVTEVTMLETPISPVNLEQLTLSPHQVLTLKIMP